jgi:hypothetical protein
MCVEKDMTAERGAAPRRLIGLGAEALPHCWTRVFRTFTRGWALGFGNKFALSHI